MDLKYIGNYGSHTNETSRSQCLDGIEILEAVLNAVFMEENKRLDEIIEEINKKREPI